MLKRLTSLILSLALWFTPVMVSAKRASVSDAEKEGIDISSITFDVYNKMSLEPYDDSGKKKSTRKPYTVRRAKHKIRILGKVGSMYVVTIQEKQRDGSYQAVPGKYMGSQKWLRRVISWDAASHAANVISKNMSQTKKAGTVEGVEGIECNDNDPLQLLTQKDDFRKMPSDTDKNQVPPEDQRLAESPSLDEGPPSDIDPPGDEGVAHNPGTPTPPLSAEDAIDRNDRHDGSFLPGCEALQDGVDQSEEGKLNQCIASIQNEVVRGARNDNGSLNRTKTFNNLYRKLNPLEQKFAANIFTVMGEAGGLVSSNPREAERKNIQELTLIMKVIQNRKDNFNNESSGRKINELDVVLDPWQFSMYNDNAHHWKSAIEPNEGNGKRRTAVAAYIAYQTTNFEPDPMINHVYHYCANYMCGPGKNSFKGWGNHFRSRSNREDSIITVSANGLTPRDHGTSSSSKPYHEFYACVDTEAQRSSSECSGDGFKRNVKRRFG